MAGEEGHGLEQLRRLDGTRGGGEAGQGEGGEQAAHGGAPGRMTGLRV